MPLFEFDDNFDALLKPYRADAEHLAHVDEAQAADFHEVPHEIGARAHQNVLTFLRHHHDVIGDEAVAAFDQIERDFRFADAAAAHEQHADAIDIDERAVDHRLRIEL